MPIVATTIALFCVTVMTGLGLWQLDRKYEKEVRLEQLASRQQNVPFSLTEVLSLGQDNQDYPVSISGDLISKRLFFIDNKIHNGKVGFEVLVPLQTNQGIVLLNHGWVAGLGSRTLLPEVDIETGQHYKGMVYYPTNNMMITETNKDVETFPALLQQVDISLIQGYFDNPVLPFIINLDPDPSSGFIREWTPVVMSPDKHLGYAIQWFGLAIACLTIYLLSLMKLTQPASSKPKLSE